ncbi:MAG: DUF3842 family protein [Defluviitaleaceae bacterium]|nr:DUF3842 family protein [Defluviitaleaceae bacterium]
MKLINILVVDGMGGGIGKALIERIKTELPNIKITAVGTNAIATTAMLKAGADASATGENAIVYNASRVDFIIGVTGIIIANSMYGEVSPKMTKAISASPAHKILIPIDKCNMTVVGVKPASMQVFIKEVVDKLSEYIL